MFNGVFDGEIYMIFQSFNRNILIFYKDRHKTCYIVVIKASFNRI